MDSPLLPSESEAYDLVGPKREWILLSPSIRGTQLTAELSYFSPSQMAFRPNITTEQWKIQNLANCTCWWCNYLENRYRNCWKTMVENSRRKLYTWSVFNWLVRWQMQSIFSHDSWDYLTIYHFYQMYRIEEIHRSGLIHRDIKPGNLGVGKSGQVIYAFGKMPQYYIHCIHYFINL